MSSTSPLIYIVAFGFSFVIDILWVICVRRTSAGAALSASFWGMLCVGMSGIVTIGFVENKFLLIANMLGSFCGSMLTITLDKKRQKKEYDFEPWD